jgi:threonine aldolase
VNNDESTAPEAVGGFKLLTVPAFQGKLTPALIDEQAFGFGDEHRAQALAVTITQSSELGTIYTPDEVTAIANHAHSLGMTVHLDGARISNAAAALGVPFSAFTRDAGVDIVSFGGTKNGLMGAEAIVVLNPEAVHGLIFLRKMNMQLASKMRFVSAQLIALLEGDLWLRSASHANAMATRLRSSLEGVTGVNFTQPTQANGVFTTLPPGVADELRKEFRFYDWNPATGEVRWMCAWDTTEADVDNFAAAVRRLVQD